jgi:hypothetical protein
METETLRDFYKRTVSLNENMKGGWAPLYYGIFSKVIEENNYKKIAEVGIGYGTHAKYILNHNKNIEHLYLVDPMKFYNDDGFPRDIVSKKGSLGDNFDEMHQLINEELSQWKDKYTWFRQESVTISEEQIPANSLDCIFVDGNHTYPYVIQDLNFWWEKVSVGGQLLGDDYYMNDVARAVQDFCKSKNVTVDFLSKDSSKYKIYRLKKE